MDTVIVSQEYLENYWGNLFGNEEDSAVNYSKIQFIENFKQLASIDEPELNLYLNPKAWKYEVKEKLFEHLVTHSITSAILGHFGYDEIPNIVLSSLIGVLITPKPITLDKKGEMIYMELILIEKFKNYQSVSEWYDNLPENIRNQINISDFQELMDNLVYAGLAASKSGDYLIHSRGKHKIKIYINW